MKWVFELGAIIVNTLIRCKLKGEVSDSFIDIVTMLKDYGIDEFTARGINRNFETIADNISSSCKKILDDAGIKAERTEIIVKHIIIAYTNIKLSIEDFLNIQADADRINKKLLEANEEYTDDLEQSERELYERMLEHTSNLIVNAYMKIPEFNQEGIKRLSIKMDEITEKINDLLLQMQKIDMLVESKHRKNSNFERHYRTSVINQNSYVYLFGAGDLSSEYKKYPLSTAYVELEMLDKIYDKEIKLNKVFTKSKNIWLSGEAGMGKTTLLQWLAVKMAEDGKDIEGMRDSIPLIIHLRKYDCSNLSLKKCIYDVMKDSSYDVPEGWIDDIMSAGRMVFLIDGFDEISENDRIEVLNWLSTVDKDEKCKKIFTSRPQVKERPTVTDLKEIKILPMDRIRIKKFIDYWHKAVLDEQLKVDEEEAKSTANELFEKIGLSDSLLKLASTPLLCAMLCALHYRNEMSLPTNKRELYEECCKMLIERRDEERKIIRKEIKLDYEKKKIILAQLAYWMMKNNHVQISFEDVEKSIQRSIIGMNIPKERNIEKIIFKYLFERCGILREPEKEKIDFLHRTFQEYLTAFEISRQEDWGFLKEKIGNDTWQETIGLCIGYAKKEIATEIIENTLERGRELCEEKKYLFLSIEYLSGAIEVDEEIRADIEKRVSSLIPPSFEECDELSKAGDLVTPYLENKVEYSIVDKLACIQVLRKIGTIKALEISKTYLNGRISKLEILHIGYLYSQFSERELIETEIPRVIKSYIEKCASSTVVLHDKMLKVLKLLYRTEGKVKFSKKIRSLEILEYDDERYSELINLFKNVTYLQLQGDFEKGKILSFMPNIKELSIYSMDNCFSLYALNDYINIYEIDSFCAILPSEEFFNGKELYFLSKCKKLEIVFLNNLSDVSFEYIGNLYNVEELTVGAEFGLELDYTDLPNNIEKLTVMVPADYVENGHFKKYIQTNVINVQLSKLEDFLNTKIYWAYI